MPISSEYSCQFCFILAEMAEIFCFSQGSEPKIPPEKLSQISAVLVDFGQFWLKFSSISVDFSQFWLKFRFVSVDFLINTISKKKEERKIWS